MSDLAIQVENISKKYALGAIGSGTLRETLAHGWDRLRGRNGHANGAEKEFWALQDINFEVKQGEVVGIIGKNGAGKSTLLKVLSRITEPTTGQIKLNGRVSSLLEVGTGFHPELTGRENIFLNGSILGMSREEIKQKFDEIVAFSGVEKFLDTPVKRYSSGMKVRLAFAVSAHLEPEILVIDEVLAVGDAEFQKKCLGKMQDVAGQGRTVLFVSHNMGAVSQLCSSAILIETGRIKLIGETQKILNFYISKNKANHRSFFEPQKENIPTSEDAKRVGLFLQKASLIDQKNRMNAVFNYKEPIKLKVEWNQTKPIPALAIGIQIYNQKQQLLSAANTLNNDATFLQDGKHEIQAIIDPNVLNPGLYFVSVGAYIRPHTKVERFDQCLCFEVTEKPHFANQTFNLKGNPVFSIPVKWEKYETINS